MPLDLDTAYANAANEERKDEQFRAFMDERPSQTQVAGLDTTTLDRPDQQRQDQPGMDPGAFGGRSPLSPPPGAPATRFSPPLGALATGQRDQQRPVDFGTRLEAPEQPAQPQRQQRYQPFIPSQGPYHPRDWGKPDLALLGSFRYPGLAPSPWMPQRQDMNALMRQVLGFFMQSGSNPVKGMARNLMGLRGAAINSFLKGYMQAAKFRHDQMKEQEEEMHNRLQEEFRDFSSAFISYGPESAKFNEQQLNHRLNDLIAQYDDDELRRALQNGGYAEVQRIIDTRHARGLDFWKGRTQATKAERDEEEDDRLTTPDQPKQPTTTGAAPTQQPAPTGAPAAPGAPQAPAAPEPQTGVPQLPAPLNQEIRRSAVHGFMDGEDRGKYPAAMPKANAARQREIDNITKYYSDVLNNPNLPQGDDDASVKQRMDMIMPAMENISPLLGQHVRHILGGGEVTTRDKSNPGWQAAIDAASKIDPKAGSQLGDLENRSRLLVSSGDFRLATAGVRASQQGQRTDTAILNGAIKILQDEHGMERQQAVDYLARQRLRWQTAGATTRAFAIGRQGDQVRALNVSISHLDTLERLGRELDNPTTVRPLNRIFQDIAAATGRSAPVDFNAARQIIGEEIVKSVVSGGGGVTERLEAGRNLDRALTGGQIGDVAKTYRTLMAGQMLGLEKQYRAGGGPDDFRSTFLLPATQRALEGAIERPVGDWGQTAPAGAAPAAPAAPGGLPPGWRFR